MKKAVSIFVMFFLLHAVHGCKSDSHLPPLAYAQYMEDAGNGMIRIIDDGNLSYKVQLATSQYVVSKELGDDEAANKETFARRLEALKDYTFFYIAIESSGPSKMTDPALAEPRVSYYAQSAASDIRLKSGDEVLLPATYHFENNYGLSPFNKILVAFKTEQRREGDFQLVFNDRFNGNFLLRTSFNAKSIAQLPTLEIK